MLDLLAERVFSLKNKSRQKIYATGNYNSLKIKITIVKACNIIARKSITSFNLPQQYILYQFLELLSKDYP